MRVDSQASKGDYKAMNKFLEAKEKKGVSYSDIATGIGEPVSYRTAIASIFSIETMCKPGAVGENSRYLELSQTDIKKAYLEQRMIYLEKRKFNLENKEVIERKKKNIQEKQKNIANELKVLKSV
jgi:hypothetical protein